MSNEFNNRDGFDQLVNAFSSKSFNIPNGGKIFYEKTNALTAIDIDSSNRNLSNGGINQFSKEALLLSLNLIRLRNASGQISIDLPRLNQQQMKSRIFGSFLPFFPQERDASPNFSFSSDRHTLILSCITVFVMVNTSPPRLRAQYASATFL